jgi:hypothetical protein
MPVSLVSACPLCGLRLANRALLELHVREDHRQRPPPRDSVRTHGLPALRRDLG